MLVECLIVLVCAIAALHFYIKHLYLYWCSRGVPQITPTFPFGNLGKSIRNELSNNETLDELYRSTDAPFIGIYSVFSPCLMPRDPELIRNILVKDFQHFADRGVYLDAKNDPLSTHLFSLEGEEWKNQRSKLTPTFTSGKMRGIFQTMAECRPPLMKRLQELENQTFEVRDVMSLYTINLIASVAFGIEIDCFADPENPFRKYAQKMTEPTLKNTFRLFCFLFCPTLLKWSGLHFLDRDTEEFLMDIVRQTLELRESGQVVRKDFFQLLVQLRNTGTVQMDDEWGTTFTNQPNKMLSIEQMTAQSFLFYLAGFETSASTMSFLMYEVAKNPEIQQKLHAEIDAILDQSPDGEFTYDTIGELKYLECCFDGEFLHACCLFVVAGIVRILIFLLLLLLVVFIIIIRDIAEIQCAAGAESCLHERISHSEHGCDH